MNDYKELCEELRSCAEKGYFAPCEMENAADAIEQLLAENAKLKAEREAAVSDLSHVLHSLRDDAGLYGESVCGYCKHHREEDGECKQDCNSRAYKWEWRGVDDTWD